MPNTKFSARNARVYLHVFLSFSQQELFEYIKRQPHEALSLKIECKYAKTSIFCTPIMQIWLNLL
jgi:hypothetical protein